MPKQCKTQSNGRVNLRNVYKPVWDPGNVCVLLPLGSPTVSPKRSYVHAASTPSAAGSVHMRWCTGGVWYWVGILGGYTGWVYGVLYRVLPSCSRRGPGTAERAPEPLQGVEWVVPGARTSLYTMVRTRPLDHPLQPPWGFRGPLRCPGPSLRAKGEI